MELEMVEGSLNRLIKDFEAHLWQAAKLEDIYDELGRLEEDFDTEELAVIESMNALFLDEIDPPEDEYAFTWNDAPRNFVPITP